MLFIEREILLKMFKLLDHSAGVEFSRFQFFLALSESVTL